eukprot:gene13225-19066_t
MTRRLQTVEDRGPWLRTTLFTSWAPPPRFHQRQITRWSLLQSVHDCIGSIATLFTDRKDEREKERNQERGRGVFGSSSESADDKRRAVGPRQLRLIARIGAVASSLVMRLAGSLGRLRKPLGSWESKGVHVVAHTQRASGDAVQGSTPPTKTPKAKPELVPPTPIPPPKLPLGDMDAFLNGVLLIDKPTEWTSMDVCGKTRNMLYFLGKMKVGHAGTLDPMATGLLLVCTGKGTKYIDNFTVMQKSYSGTFRLGEATASYDAESEVTETKPWEHITDDDLKAAAKTFLGDIEQVPPMYSAIKGQKLCNLARLGEEVDRPPRPVHIFEFSVQRDAADPQ